MNGTVTLAHPWILRQKGGERQGGHPWMLHGWHSNSGIHGYLTEGGGKVSIHGQSMDGTVTLASILRQRGVARWMVHGWHCLYGYLDKGGEIDGWPIDGQTESSMWPLMDGPWISLVRPLATLSVIL